MKNAALDLFDLQDHVVGVASDLERLQQLLADASGALLRAWAEASACLALQASAEPAVRAAAEALARSAPALQFDDLASQLLAHGGQRLRHCADRLAELAFDGDPRDPDPADDAGAEFALVAPPPGRPSPVGHDRLDIGSVELF